MGLSLRADVIRDLLGVNGMYLSGDRHRSSPGQTGFSYLLVVLYVRLGLITASSDAGRLIGRSMGSRNARSGCPASVLCHVAVEAGEVGNTIRQRATMASLRY